MGDEPGVETAMERVVLVDEKMCPVRGRWRWLYLAVDTTGDIMHCRAVPEFSSIEAASFLRGVQALLVEIKGLVTDLDRVLTRAVEVVRAEMPHQYCIKHALAATGILIGYVERDVRRSRESRSKVEEEVGHRRHHDVGKDVSGDRVTVAASIQKNRSVPISIDGDPLHQSTDRVSTTETIYRLSRKEEASQREVEVVSGQNKTSSSGMGQKLPQKGLIQQP